MRDNDEPSPEPEHPDESAFWQDHLSRTAQERFEEESMHYYEKRRLDLWRAGKSMAIYFAINSWSMAIYLAINFWKFFGELIVFGILYWLFYYVHYEANKYDYDWCVNPHVQKTDYCETIDWIKKYCPQQREMFKQAMGAFFYNKLGMIIDWARPTPRS